MSTLVQGQIMRFASRLPWFVVLLLACIQLAHAERTTTYFHTDNLGSVVAASDTSGNLLWRKSYAPFGEQIDTNVENERLSYTGKLHDEVTELTYFGGRYYDPEVGRFISVDPVGFVESNPMSFNRYAYVNNNPYKYVDPDGEFLNFAAKFVLDVGVNIAFNYVTTGEMDVGGALKESVVGLLNPAKTVAKVGKLAKVLAKAEKRLPAPCKIRCFAAGTTVLTDEGFVAIETLEVGDLVWAYNPDTGERAFKPIVKTFVNTKDTIWHLALVKNGVSYRHEVTGSHPYFVPSVGWLEVAHLRVGSELLTEDGTRAVVTGVFDTGVVQPTYNLEVADINTYYVSAAKVLVHNCNELSEFAKLNRSLASESQMADLNSGVAERIAGAGTTKKLKDAQRLSSEYGGDAPDWAKIRSSSHAHTDGFRQESHAYQNVTTGQIVEHKTKIEGH